MVLGCWVCATVNGKTVGTGKEFVRWTRRPAGPGYEDTDCSEDSEGDTESGAALVAPDAAPPRQPVAPGRQQPAAAAALQPQALHAQRQPLATARRRRRAVRAAGAAARPRVRRARSLHPPREPSPYEVACA